MKNLNVRKREQGIGNPVEIRLRPTRPERSKFIIFTSFFDHLGADRCLSLPLIQLYLCPKTCVPYEKEINEISYALRENPGKATCAHTCIQIYIYIFFFVSVYTYDIYVRY